MKYRWSAIFFIFSLLLVFSSCSTSSSSTTANGTGYLWLTAQGNATVQAYTIATSNGSLSLNGPALPSGPTPTSILISPKGDAVFVLNSGASSGVSAFTVNNDGTLKAAGTMVAAGPNPKGMTINPAGTFLFVANQGTFDLTQPGSISVFSVTGTTVAQVAGSPFSTEASGASIGTGPVSVAVSASGNYLYVANQFENSVSSFQVSSAGTLTPLSTYPVGIAPSAVFVSIAQGTTVPAGQYLYVANTGSNNISAFSICDSQNASGCSSPNGVLAAIAGSPFPAQPGPVAIAMDPNTAFLYVADEQANQISQFAWSSGTGALTALTTAAVSAGGNPVSLAIRSGIAATSTTAGTDYMYVANLNGSTLSAFTLNTTTGVLNALGSAVATPSQPSSVTAR